MVAICRAFIKLSLILSVSGGVLAQGKFSLSSSDPQDLIITNLTSDKNITVTNNAGSTKITVTVFEDLDNDGKYDPLKDLYIEDIFIEDGESGSIEVPAGRECEISRFYKSGAAKGSWVYI